MRLSHPKTILETNQTSEVKGHPSAFFPGRFGRVAIRQWPLTPLSAKPLYGVISRAVMAPI